MVCYYVMANRVHRTSFALDEASSQRLRRLAARWKVSQAEVVRRSLERAEDEAVREKSDPATVLRGLFAAGKGLDPEKASAYIDEVYEDRKHWRGQ